MSDDDNRPDAEETPEDDEVVTDLGDREMLGGGTLDEHPSEASANDAESQVPGDSPDSAPVTRSAGGESASDGAEAGEHGADPMQEAKQSLVEDEDEMELELAEDPRSGGGRAGDDTSGGEAHGAGTDSSEGEADPGGELEAMEVEAGEESGRTSGSHAAHGTPRSSGTAPSRSSGSWKKWLFLVVFGAGAGLVYLAVTSDWGIADDVQEKVGLVDEVEKKVENSVETRKNRVESKAKAARTAAESNDSESNSVADRAADMVESVTGGSGSKYTTQGIFEAVATSRWTPAGESSFIEVDGTRRVIRDYEWDGARMRVRIQSFDAKKAAKKHAGSVESPEVGMPIGPHAVTLIPKGDTDPFTLQEAENVLEKYHRMMKAK